MGRDQNDNAIKVQHHRCGIALSAKAGPGKIRDAVARILSEDSFRQIARSFQQDIQANDRGTSVLQEIESLIVPSNDKNERVEKVSVRYA
jgi:UDP:flavonoid glycosyltransferase YjiC (YdhE family)